MRTMTPTVAATFLRWLFAAATPTMSLLAQGDAAPKIEEFHFQGTTLGGRSLNQEALRGHVVIVDIWGTWCGPCRQAVPVLVDLYQKYKQHGLEVVGFGFAADGTPEDAGLQRKFAVENKITYELLLGDAAVRDQVPKFRGYPTMLLFEPGWRHVDTHVGFDGELGTTLETWLRRALKLDADPAADAPVQKEPVPDGRWFVPGNGDTGVTMPIELLDGTKLTLAAPGSGPTLLAVTTSWDQEAVRTARFLQGLQTGGGGVRILAWHVERAAGQDQKQAVTREFLHAQGATYPAFATGLKEIRDKVHRFASLPTLLLFDAQGVLIAREEGISDAIEERLRGQLAELASPK